MSSIPNSSPNKSSGSYSSNSNSSGTGSGSSGPSVTVTQNTTGGYKSQPQGGQQQHGNHALRGPQPGQPRQFMNSTPLNMDCLPTRVQRQIKCLPPQYMPSPCYPPMPYCPPAYNCAPPPCYPPCYQPPPPCAPCYYPPPPCPPPFCYPPPPCPPPCPAPCMPPPCLPCIPPPCPPCLPICIPRRPPCFGGSGLICLPRGMCGSSGSSGHTQHSMAKQPFSYEQPASFNNCNFYVKEPPKGFGPNSMVNGNGFDKTTNLNYEDNEEFMMGPFDEDKLNTAAGDDKIVPPPYGYPGSNRRKVWDQNQNQNAAEEHVRDEQLSHSNNKSNFMPRGHQRNAGQYSQPNQANLKDFSSNQSVHINAKPKSIQPSRSRMNAQPKSIQSCQSRNNANRSCQGRNNAFSKSNQSSQGHVALKVSSSQSIHINAKPKSTHPSQSQINLQPRSIQSSQGRNNGFQSSQGHVSVKTDSNQSIHIDVNPKSVQGSRSHVSVKIVGSNRGQTTDSPVSIHSSQSQFTVRPNSQPSRSQINSVRSTPFGYSGSNHNQVWDQNPTGTSADEYGGVEQLSHSNNNSHFMSRGHQRNAGQYSHLNQAKRTGNGFQHNGAPGHKGKCVQHCADLCIPKAHRQIRSRNTPRAVGHFPIPSSGGHNGKARRRQCKLEACCVVLPPWQRKPPCKVPSPIKYPKKNCREICSLCHREPGETCALCHRTGPGTKGPRRSKQKCQPAHPTHIQSTRSRHTQPSGQHMGSGRQLTAGKSSHSKLQAKSIHSNHSQGNVMPKSNQSSQGHFGLKVSSSQSININANSKSIQPNQSQTNVQPKSPPTSQCQSNVLPKSNPTSQGHLSVKTESNQSIHIDIKPKSIHATQSEFNLMPNSIQPTQSQNQMVKTESSQSIQIIAKPKPIQFSQSQNNVTPSSQIQNNVTRKSIQASRSHVNVKLKVRSSRGQIKVTPISIKSSISQFTVKPKSQPNQSQMNVQPKSIHSCHSRNNAISKSNRSCQGQNNAFPKPNQSNLGHVALKVSSSQSLHINAKQKSIQPSQSQMTLQPKSIHSCHGQNNTMSKSNRSCQGQNNAFPKSNQSNLSHIDLKVSSSQSLHINAKQKSVQPSQSQNVELRSIHASQGQNNAFPNSNLSSQGVDVNVTFPAGGHFPIPSSDDHNGETRRRQCKQDVCCVPWQRKPPCKIPAPIECPQKTPEICPICHREHGGECGRCHRTGYGNRGYQRPNQNCQPAHPTHIQPTCLTHIQPAGQHNCQPSQGQNQSNQGVDGVFPGRQPRGVKRRKVTVPDC